MKTVRIAENAVAEIIPDDALPVAKWYGEAFAAQCVEAPDEVEAGWTYNPETRTFAPPAAAEDAETQYTELQRLGQQITEEELARIALGQQVTDLELMILGGNANV